MHEMGIALQVIQIATESIPPEHRGAQVARIHLEVGKLSAVVPESLRFCFEIAAAESAVAGAELVIEELPVVARCRACDHKWTIDHPAFSCEKCQSGDLELISGRELDIRSIEIEN